MGNLLLETLHAEASSHGHNGGASGFSRALGRGHNADFPGEVTPPRGSGGSLYANVTLP